METLLFGLCVLMLVVLVVILGEVANWYFHNLPLSGFLLALVVFWIYFLADWLIVKLRRRVKGKRKVKRD